ncbi:MAG: diacylglycerol/lipid kinase family protein [Bacteroidia bacterium]
MKKVAFIINPNSGSGKGLTVGKKLSKELEGTGIQYTLNHTEGKGHATTLTKSLLETGVDLVVACGGDGTVNETANALTGTNIPMAILPIGSGNGLARHYGIKYDLKQLSSVIHSNKIIRHDAVSINGLIGFNVSGIGFDAHVAFLFGKDGKRGFNSYLKLIVKEFYNYQPFETEITYGNTKVALNAMMIPIAVASQFGNSAFIAPLADTMDGMTDITVVRKMHPFQVLPFAIRVFTKAIGGSGYAKCLREKTFEIRCKQPQPLHVDGEPSGYHDHFKIETMPAAISLAIP